MQKNENITKPNNESKKSGFVSIIGRPNVGKSTLMNKIIGQKIAITSNKPQTTRNRIQTVYTSDKGQIIFVDTPGMHKAKNKLGNFMMSEAKSTLGSGDVILYLIEPSSFIGEGERDILNILKTVNVPVILVINKIDTVSRESIAGVIETFSKELDFSEIIPISAYEGKNVDELIDNIYKYLPYGPYYFDEDQVTDQPVRQICAEIIREKALHRLDKEIPHGIAVVIDSMKYRERKPKEGEKYGESGIYDIDATIICEKDSHKGIIIGKGGSMLKKIGSLSRPDMETMLDTKVNLKLFVKVKPDWRDSDYLVKNFGYVKEED